MNLLWDKLVCQYEHGKTVPGTRSYHQLCPVSVDQIGYKQISDDKDLAGTFTLSMAVNPKVSFVKFLPINMLHVIMTVTCGWEWCRM